MDANKSDIGGGTRYGNKYLYLLPTRKVAKMTAAVTESFLELWKAFSMNVVALTLLADAQINDL